MIAENSGISEPYDAVVIGGGFYGATLAVALAKVGRRVALVEKESGLLQRASYVNQARVHNGYHYPRSILTSLRSRVNYSRFRSEYAEAVSDNFTTVYAVAKRLSKLNAQQFVRFCNRIGAQISPAPKNIASLFDPLTIEASFVVTECAFDARRLTTAVEGQLAESNVEIFLDTTAVRISSGPDSLVQVECVGGSGQFELTARNVFNCTYSAANRLLDASGFPLVPLKHELTEIALVDVPAEFQGLGITVMDGPFFSVMPFPPSGAHSMTHVRYTPHATWQDHSGASADRGTLALRHPPASSFPHMLRDISRYVPHMSGARYRESLWEIKTVLPQSEHDDSRPILLHRTPGVAGLWTVLGAKIDGAYDVQERLLELTGVAEQLQ